MALQIFNFTNSNVKLPLYQSRIQCGFPSPADDYLEGVLSLDEICINNKETTFLGRVTGKSLTDINIYEGDILVIDRSLKAVSGDLIVAAISF
ncbi:LexA family protein [Pedobacter helvus]|uniref:LexA family protein n=1 Tax=Pedobacter helvus TaxID=2563444 RepID=A0ABW9JFQ9_9SPHI|nr:S24 family peptidase [Pedobacter ureilyticus]